jgi:ribonuclease D
MTEPATPLTEASRVEQVAAALRRVGLFALDLEFVSEGKYIPELALVQVAWEEDREVRVALMDPLAVDPRPVVEVVADAAVATVIHAAQGDLALLAARFGVVGAGLVDSQIAAAFLGLGEQISYVNLVGSVLGVQLDKSWQFTDWLRRPLAPDQLTYAAADVRYLLPAWRELERRLEDRGRSAWVREESERLARAAAQRPGPAEAYLKVAGQERLSARQRGALKELAAWREREALATNTPPAWILKDRPLLELARRPPRDAGQLAQVRDVTERTVRRFGAAILEALGRGAREPVAAAAARPVLPDRGRSAVTLLLSLIQARCAEADLAARFVAGREDVEQLVGWWLAEGTQGPPELPLLGGWRRELAGEAALDWLAGRIALRADRRAPAGVRLCSLEEREGGV